MIEEFLVGEACKWCGRDLSQSYLTRLGGGIAKGSTIVHPVLCICGGITVVGAGTFVSHFDQLDDGASRGRG